MGHYETLGQLPIADCQFSIDDCEEQAIYFSKNRPGLNARSQRTRKNTGLYIQGRLLRFLHKKMREEEGGLGEAVEWQEVINFDKSAEN